MLLGDLLASFEDDEVAAQTALRLIDLTTLNRMRQHADANGITVGEYAQCSPLRRWCNGRKGVAHRRDGLTNDPARSACSAPLLT
jgi:hypothetical protein